MRCTIYDWMSQSDSHLAHGQKNWPLTTEVFNHVADRNQFLQVARSANFANKQKLQRERDDWFSKYGYSWKRLGCPRETWMNQRSFLMTAPVMGATSVFDEDYGEDDDWFDDLTGTSSGDLPPMYEGAAGDPTPPTGYKVCYNPSVQGMPVTVDVPTSQTGWRVDHYVGSDDELYYFYHSTWGDSFWACPQKSSSAVSNKEEIKQIQRALSKRGFNPGAIDGIWGPKTCSAMYAYSYQYKGFAEPTLDEDLFASLELGGRGYGARYARSCDSWFTGELGGTPTPIVEEDDPVVVNPVEPPRTPTGTLKFPPKNLVAEPEVNKAGFGWVLGILVAGTILGTAWVQSKKNKKKGRK